MRRLLFLLSSLAVAAGGLRAQLPSDLIAYVHTPGDTSDGTPLGSSLSFPATTVGGQPGSQVIRLINKSTTNSYEVTAIYFKNVDVFGVTGTFLDKCLAPGGNEDFTVTFTPTSVSGFDNTLFIKAVTFSAGLGCTAIGGVSSLGSTAVSGNGLAAVIGTGGTGSVQPGELSLTYVETNGSTNTLTDGSTFDFGRIEQGKTSTEVLTLTNSSTLAVTVPPIAASGPPFSIVGSIPSPLVIPAGGRYSFTLQFAPDQPTPFTGALKIGAQSVGLTGIGYAPPFPAVTLTFTPTTIGNQQQAQVMVKLASPAPYQSVGTLSMQFTPSSITTAVDNAIVFAATGGTNLSVTFAKGDSVGTYSSASAFTFQTGTTAGNLTFAFTMQGVSPATQTFALAPSPVQITAATVQWLAPSIVLNLTGYDNSYSASKMVFTFYGANGAVLTPGGMTVDATTNFQQYFGGEKGFGGAFILQANFPVTGYSVGPTCLGVPSPPASCVPASAVDVTIQNNVGTSATQHVVF